MYYLEDMKVLKTIWNEVGKLKHRLATQIANKKKRKVTETEKEQDEARVLEGEIFIRLKIMYISYSH